MKIDDATISKILFNHRRLAFLSNILFSTSSDGETLPFEKYDMPLYTRETLTWLDSVDGNKDEDGNPVHYNMGWICKRVHPAASSTSVTRAVETLVRAGFAERYHINNNRRTIYVRITDAGREVMRETREIMLRAVKARVEKHLSAAETEELLACYEKTVGLLFKMDEGSQAYRSKHKSEKLPSPADFD